MKIEVSFGKARVPVFGVAAAAAALVLTLALSGCADAGRGSSAPPEAFGAVSRTFFGCPDIQGIYAWPPQQGAYSRGLLSERQRPNDVGFPVPIHGTTAQLWITQNRGGIVFRSRSGGRARSGGPSVLQAWSTAELGRAQYSCSRGGLEVVLEKMPDDARLKAEYAGSSVRRSYRIVAMKDGSLAIGLKAEVSGRNQSIFSWGGQSYGSMLDADVIHWQWMRLARTGAGQTEPAPLGG